MDYYTNSNNGGELIMRDPSPPNEWYPHPSPPTGRHSSTDVPPLSSIKSNMSLESMDHDVFKAGAVAKFAGFEDLLVTGEYSDFTIHFSDEVLHVHKIVLCSQSSFFAKACKNFKVPPFESRSKFVTPI
jgi:hypothetical protein